MNLYLDIDGTLIDQDGTQADGVTEFLDWALQNTNCYWLTTHCCDGSLEHLHWYLKTKLDSKTFELIRNIKPTKWDMIKTEAIDFSKDFLWFDDSPSYQELLELKRSGVSDCLVNIDLSEKPYINPSVLFQIKSTVALSTTMDFSVNGKKVEFRDFSDIESEINKIAESQEKSGAILGDLDHSFVQTAYENGVFLVERKNVLTKSIDRAYNRLLKGQIGFQTVHVGDYRYMLEEDEAMEAFDVVAIFESFYKGQNMPSHIDWRFYMSTSD